MEIKLIDESPAHILFTESSKLVVVNKVTILKGNLRDVKLWLRVQVNVSNGTAIPIMNVGKLSSIKIFDFVKDRSYTQEKITELYFYTQKGSEFTIDYDVID